MNLIFPGSVHVLPVKHNLVKFFFWTITIYGKVDILKRAWLREFYLVLKTLRRKNALTFDNKGEGDKAWVIKWIIFIANPATIIFSSLLAINSQRDRGGVSKSTALASNPPINCSKSSFAKKQSFIVIMRKIVAQFSALKPKGILIRKSLVLVTPSITQDVRTFHFKSDVIKAWFVIWICCVGNQAAIQPSIKLANISKSKDNLTSALPAWHSSSICCWRFNW